MPTTMHKPRDADVFPGADRLSVPVRNAMTPGVVTIAADAALSHVHRAMVAHQVHAVLVSSRVDGTPIGWVTARGVLGWLDRDDSLASASDAISEPVVTIDASLTAREALALLLERGVSHLLVTRGDAMIAEGVLTELDLVALLRR